MNHAAIQNVLDTFRHLRACSVERTFPHFTAKLNAIAAHGASPLQIAEGIHELMTGLEEESLAPELILEAREILIVGGHSYPAGASPPARKLREVTRADFDIIKARLSRPRGPDYSQKRDTLAAELGLSRAQVGTVLMHIDAGNQPRDL